MKQFPNCKDQNSTFLNEGTKIKIATITGTKTLQEKS